MKKVLKKIVYVIPAFPVASETFITTEMKALMSCGHEVQGVCFEHRDEACQVGDEGILESMIDIRDIKLSSLIPLIFKVLFLLRRSGWRAIRFAFSQQGIRPRSLLLQSLKLAYIADKTGCEHIHAHFALCSTATAIVAARLLGLTISFTSHGSDVYKSPSDLALKLQNADFSIAVCKRMQIDFKNFTPMAHVYNVPCGIDLAFFDIHNKTDSFSSLSDERGLIKKGLAKKLLYLGRISETKGILHLIQAIAKLPSHLRPNIDIAGDGPMRLESEQMVRDFGITDSVTFLGCVNRSWVQKNGSNYAAMVLPFCKVEGGIMDTGPLVIKEALALKLPLLTTDIMATGEFVDSECAFISKSSDPDDLARTLLKLLVALTYIELDQEGLNRIQSVLGPQVFEINSLIQHPNPYEVVQHKVECGYRKVTSQFSSEQQALTLSKIFQQ